ncbi:uncharacterized protein LOC129338473 [Eublepharis macularius]|uniref:Uncharacterized protein LOC129338473 n=1 Tax=Eublepharis macularius TaxID=481883 RepID=A0AA97K4B9_EUBMA|nr:uncharacterized protein LOC129338473 [Eublepharis macularius]
MDQNFTGMAHLQNLSARQLAQLTLTEEVFSSVANVDRVFHRLARLSTLEDLAAISGINRGFSEIPEEGKRDILNYMVSFLSQKSKTTGPACSAQVTTRNWLLQFFGKFSEEALYTQLVSCYHQAFDAPQWTGLETSLAPSAADDSGGGNAGKCLRASAGRSLSAAVDGAGEQRLPWLCLQWMAHKISVLPNSEVAQLFLANYLALRSSQLEAYTAGDWNATFHEELRFLCPVISATTLAYIVPRDFKSLSTIVARLSEAHPHMTESSRRAVVLWIVQNFEVLKGNQIDSIAEWIQAVWGSFFLDATLEEVKSMNENFSPSSALGFLSISQLMEFVKTSDAPTNVTEMRIILSSLKTERSEIPLPKMHEFLTRFNQAIEQNKVIITEEVRLEILSTVFTNLARHFRTFTALDYGAWFSKLKLFLPSINKDLLQMIPLDLSFLSYTPIIRGLDHVYPDLPQEASSEIYLFMKQILELQVNISGTAFPGTYKDSQSFLQSVFYRFVRFAKYADFLTFYKDFNGYDVLPLLTTKQMGEMMILTNAIKHELLAVQILVELEKRPPAEVKGFTLEFNAVAREKRLTLLPDLRICSLILETLFKLLQFHTFSAEQYAFWFGVQLQPFLSALSPKHLHQIPLDIDCPSHQNLVKALEEVYMKYTMDQKNAIHKRILNYLESYQKDEGVTCSPNANSSQWLLRNYGRFRALASISEFSSLNVNFNRISAIGELFPRQLADVVASSGALADGNLLKEIMSHVGTLEDIAEFLDKLNIIAPVELQSSTHASSVLSHAFRTIAAHFPGFKASDFTYWFQGAFQNVLHTVNETLVAQIPLRLSCGSYQQILKGFNNVYANMPAKSSLNIFKFCKAFLASKIKSGIACGYPTRSIPDWLEINLGNFSRYAEYQDLTSWNLHFDGMAVLQSLSPPQLASLTLQSDAISEEEEMFQILARLENKPLEVIYQYLDQFNVEARKFAITSLKEEVIREKMLSRFMGVIGAGFSAFRPGNWTYLLSTRLALFLPSVGEKESKQILSHVSDCDSFRAVVSSLSQVYSAIPATNQESIYRSFFAFLESQQSTTGSACASKTRGTESWLQDNLGAFAAKAPYDDFAKLIADFNGFEVRDNLTSAQLAHAFFESGILDSPVAVGALLIPLESRPLEEIVPFVEEFTAVASQRGIMFLANLEVRDRMFHAVFSKVLSLLTTASISQYKDWFQDKLNLWLPSINASTLDSLPRTIPCSVFKIIMAGLDGAFQRMSLKSRNDVYAFAKHYLATKTSQGGDPCTENTPGSLGWLRSNLGSFSSLASYKDLIDISAEFRAMDAREGLTPAQLADYTLASDVLRDREKAGKILGSLSANNIGEFMDAFNAGAKQKQLSQLPHQETRRFILGEIFCHLSSLFPLFATKDYTVWFGERLYLFLSSLDTQNLGFIPSDVSCDALATIMDALTDHHVNNTFENPGNVASFIKRVLHSQLQNSGSACTVGASTDRQWLTRFFGPFAAFCSYSDFVELKSDFRGQDSLDLFSANTLAQLSTQSHTIYSRRAMMRVYEAIQEKKDSFQFLAAYLDEFNTIALKNHGLLSNPKVQHTMLMLTANMLFPQIDAVLPEEAAAWFQKLGLLLPGINGTMLDLLPHTMPCPYYHIIVKALGDAYSKLSTRKRQEVYRFQKAYLAAQFADSGSACDSGNAGVRGWLMENLGDFCSVAKLTELQAFYPGLNEIDNPAGLRPMQAADFTLLGPMCNSALASMAVGLMKTFENYQSLHEYLYRLQSVHCQHEFFSNVLSFLKKRGSSMDTSQWADIAQFLLSDLVLALNTSRHSQPASNGTCETFQAMFSFSFKESRGGRENNTCKCTVSEAS